MKVLIAPMAAIAETSGPFSRAKALAIGLLKKDHIPGFSAAKDINYWFSRLRRGMGPDLGCERAYARTPNLGIYHGNYRRA